MTYYGGSEASFEEPWCYPNLSMFVANPDDGAEGDGGCGYKTVFLFQMDKHCQ